MTETGFVVCECGRHGDYIYPGARCVCGRIVKSVEEQARLYPLKDDPAPDPGEPETVEGKR